LLSLSIYIHYTIYNSLIKKMPSLLEAKEQVRFQYLNHKHSNRDIENEVLSKEINQIFEENKGRYGSIRIAKVLDKKGIHVNRKRVSRLMRNMKLLPKGCRYHYKHYNQEVNIIETQKVTSESLSSKNQSKPGTLR